LVVVQYKQNDLTKTKKIATIIEIDLTNSMNLLFGTLTRPEIEELVKCITKVPQKRKPTKEEHKNMYTLRNALQQKSGAIHLDIKCNSTQSRLQCSFNRFEKFLEENPTRIVARSNSNKFRGGIISEEINSPRRIFKKKLPE
jgi:Zn-dependent M32 family carboxypeptidase